MLHYNDEPNVCSTTERIKKKEKEIEVLRKKNEFLLKKEELKNKKAVELSNRLKELKEKRDEIDRDITKTTIELNKHCTHEKTRTEEYNYPGGYLDRAEHRKIFYCELCGVKVDEKVTYGGFG